MYGLVVCEPIWTGSPADIPLHFSMDYLMHGQVVCELIWTDSPADIPLHSTSGPSGAWMSDM